MPRALAIRPMLAQFNRLACSRKRIGDVVGRGRPARSNCAQTAGSFVSRAWRRRAAFPASARSPWCPRARVARSRGLPCSRFERAIRCQFHAFRRGLATERKNCARGRHDLGDIGLVRSRARASSRKSSLAVCSAGLMKITCSATTSARFRRRAGQHGGRLAESDAARLRSRASARGKWVHPRHDDRKGWPGSRRCVHATRRDRQLLMASKRA